MTINGLCFWMVVGWRLRRQPTTIPYKEDVISVILNEVKNLLFFAKQQ